MIASPKTRITRIDAKILCAGDTPYGARAQRDGQRSITDGRTGMFREGSGGTHEVVARSNFSMQPLKVLIVDDDPDDRFLSSRIVQRELPGAELLELASALDALDLLTRQSVDLIMLNHTLVDMRGPDLVRALREQGVTTPVLVVSAHPGNVREEALEAGANAFVDKMDRVGIGRALRELISNHALSPCATPHGHRGAQPPADSPNDD